MTNPHCRPPVPFGTETPDGGLVLHPEEARWLRDVFSRIDIAQSQIAEPLEMRAGLPPELLRENTLRQVVRSFVNLLEPVIDTEEDPQTDEDEGRGLVRLRGKLTIIRGGLPPRPAF